MLIKFPYLDLCLEYILKGKLCALHNFYALWDNLTIFGYYGIHRVASTPELATNFIDYKQMAGMTTVRKSCYYAVLSRRYALRWIYFYLNIFIFEIYTQQWYESDF